MSLLFEGEMDADGPDLSFACTTIQVERMLVNSRCVRAICLCARCNRLLKHPLLSHWERVRRQTKRAYLCSATLCSRGRKKTVGQSFEQLHCTRDRERRGGERESKEERGALAVAKCQHDKSNLYKQSQL